MHSDPAAVPGYYGVTDISVHDLWQGFEPLLPEIIRGTVFFGCLCLLILLCVLLTGRDNGTPRH